MKAIHFAFVAALMLLILPRAHAQGGELPLRNGDRVTISIGAVPDNEVAQIRGVYTVSDSGTINLLHIGAVRATGLKPSALQRAIEQTYIAMEIYTKPNVLVSIDNGSDSTGRMVYVTGVQKPGPVPFKQGMRLSQVIQFAGGPTPYATMKRVKLVRAGRSTEHNLSKYTGDPNVDVLVQPEDQVILPE